MPIVNKVTHLPNGLYARTTHFRNQDLRPIWDSRFPKDQRLIQGASPSLFINTQGIHFESVVIKFHFREGHIDVFDEAH